jgi:hypothetical protein
VAKNLRVECPQAHFHATRDDFDAYKSWHTSRQQVLQRPARRNYDARYQSRHKAPEKNAPLPPGLPWPPPSYATNETLSPIRRSFALFPAPDQKPEPFKKMQEVLQRYPAYDIGIEVALTPSSDLKCRSCDAVFTLM